MARPLQSILTRTEAEQTIIQSNVARSFVGQRIAQHYMDAMGERLGVHDILETCDLTGVSQTGYDVICKK
jgi:hypothetical protein